MIRRILYLVLLFIAIASSQTFDLSGVIYRYGGNKRVFTMELDGSNDPIITLQGTGTIIVNWGDESSNTYNLTGVDKNITHSYLFPSEHTVKIYNSNHITKFSTSTDNNYSFDLKELQKFNNVFFYFWVNGSNIITGNLSSISKLSFIIHFRVYGSNTITGNLSSVSELSKLYYLYVIGDNTVTGNLSSLSGLNKLYRFRIMGNNTISDYTTATWTQTGFNIFKFHPTLGSGLSSGEVDEVLIDIDADVTWTGADRTFWIAGNNAARTSASDAAVLSLQGKGVTVTTN